MDWWEEYKRRYAQLKKEGKPFFPYAVFKDTVVAFLVLCALIALAHFVGARLEDLADPNDATYNPRPEWYFLFLFQALKLFPGRLESVAAVVLPGLALLLLASVPFLDRGPERHPLRRLLWTGLGLSAMGGIVILTWEGSRSPLLNPAVERNPVVTAGFRLFQDLKCLYCHSVHGKGGIVGPDLAKVAGEHTDDWLMRHFQNPQAVVPGSPMPNFHLLEDETRELTAYVKFLSGEESYSQEAPKLFAQNCSVCHRLGKEGGEAGPNLSLIGTARDKLYIKKYISDPPALNPRSSMPAFKSQLTDVQIEDLARFLASQRPPARR